MHVTVILYIRVPHRSSLVVLSRLELHEEGRRHFTAPQWLRSTETVPVGNQKTFPDAPSGTYIGQSHKMCCLWGKRNLWKEKDYSSYWICEEFGALIWASSCSGSESFTTPTICLWVKGAILHDLDGIRKMESRFQHQWNFYFPH